MIAASTAVETAAPKPARVGYRPDIDGLRAIAVVLVVVFHAFPKLIPGGYVGVDIFFVISGYLITGIILREGQAGVFRFRHFYARRVKRIFPALAVVLTATILFGWLTLSPSAFASLGHLTATSAAYVPNFTLWHQAGYFDQSGITKPLLHLWSLGIEEQFYVVWPLLLFVCLRRRKFVVPAILVVIVASFLIGLRLLNTDPSGAYYLPWARAWELGIGALLAATQPTWSRVARGRWERIRSVGPYVGIALIAMSAFLLDAQSRFPGWAALVPTLGAALVISSDTTTVGRILGSRGFVAVGLISYPLYLWHWPLLSFTYLHFHGTPGHLVTLGVVATAFVLAAATHLMLERRLKNLPSAPLVACLVAAMTLVAGFGATTAIADGFVGNQAGSIQKVLAYAQYDPGSDGGRVYTCWLTAEQPFSAYTPDCPVQSGSPGTLVWGDSHAARLYVGIHALVGSAANLGQLTGNTCPPLVGGPIAVSGATCEQRNAQILDNIRATVPSIVILFGDWTTYGSDWSPGSAMASMLTTTVASIYRAGVGMVVVVGPAPKWVPDLPSVIYDDWNRQSSPRQLATRLSIGLDGAVPRIDGEMGATVAATKARYVSLTGLLCNSNGCITSVPGFPDKLLAWDYGHLTTDGGRFVAEQLRALGDLGR